MMDVKVIEKKLRAMKWNVVEELVEDQILVATYRDKVIELLKDGTVFLVDVGATKTDKLDEFDDPVYEDTEKSFKVENWEELRNVLVREDFITAPVSDYIKSKRERQIFYLHTMEELDREKISKILGISNINLNSIVYRLNKRLSGIRLLYSIIEKRAATA